MALKSATTTLATIQHRRGAEEKFDPDQMTAGEWAVSTDKKYVRMCFMPGLCLRMATYEAFEKDMEEIRRILVEAQDIQLAIQTWYKLAESYAHGGTGVREGEETDNAKYYAEQAKASADNAATLADIGIMTTEKAGIGKPDGETITVDADGTMHSVGVGAEGDFASKSIYGDNAISLGRNNGSAVGDKSIAYGNNVQATKNGSVAFGTNNIASGEYSHAEGGWCNSTGRYSHAEGYDVTASGEYSHAEGCGTTASGAYSHAEGHESNASGRISHSSGKNTTASGIVSYAEGYKTVAKNQQHVIGRYNNPEIASAPDGDYIMSGIGSSTAFCIGNGTSSDLSNAARIDYNGKLWCKQSYSSTGADYAELFEWADGNIDNEDRRGYFVTIDGKKIRKAESGDYILGIISGNPSVIGNTDMEWYGQFMRDEFGTFIKETYKETVKEPSVDEDGNVTEEEREVDVEFYRVNPDYDPDAPYTFRLDRPEWDAVGMLGVLPVCDDGTCEVGKFCRCAGGGIATLAEERGLDTYMVIERVTENIVSVVLK